VADTADTSYAARDSVVGDLPDAAFAPAGARPPVRAAVELIGVAQRLGSRWALRGVTLRLEAGEVVAVVGPNGSGKTTLLRVLATILTPTRGSGRAFGLDLVRDAGRVRELVAMLGHATGLYDDLSASENLAFSLRMCGMTPSHSVVEGALDAVGMSQHAAELVRSLSSGMRRRVALARLVVRRPRLLLLDEPYNTMDASGVQAVDGLVESTVRAGGTAVVVTHDLTRGGRRYDRVVALDAGRIADGAGALLTEVRS
jgi:heme exporter protein A